VTEDGQVLPQMSEKELLEGMDFLDSHFLLIRCSCAVAHTFVKAHAHVAQMYAYALMHIVQQSHLRMRAVLADPHIPAVHHFLLNQCSVGTCTFLYSNDLRVPNIKFPSSSRENHHSLLGGVP
jgi:hypothetical protein